MATQTIAIIGATGNMGSAIAKRLSGSSYRLLLLGSNREKLDQLFAVIKKNHPNADIDQGNCPVDASWEADIIIVAVPYHAIKEIAEKIKEVAAGKIVISIANPVHAMNNNSLSAAEELQILLPASKVIKTFNTKLAADIDEELRNQTDNAFIAGNDEDALQTVRALISSAGFNPVIAGDLSVSRTLENMTALLIRLQSNIQTQLVRKVEGFL
jgi:predicted dinucleotide-binding enzyme